MTLEEFCAAMSHLPLGDMRMIASYAGPKTLAVMAQTTEEDIVCACEYIREQARSYNSGNGSIYGKGPAGPMMETFE